MPPTKFQVSWPFGLGEKAKNDFQDGCHSSHLGFQIRTILAIFDLQVYKISSTVLADSIYNGLIFLAEKMCVAFALQKLLTFFHQKNISIFAYHLM